MKNKIGIVIVLILIVIFAVIAFRWVKHRMEYAITDAVFVESDSMANLSFYRVSGRIVKMFKKEGDYVKKGEVIAQIDDRDYMLKLQKINAQIQSLKQKKESLNSKLSKIKSQIDIKIKQAELTKEQVISSIKALEEQKKEISLQIELIQKDRERFKNLLGKGLVPQREFEQIDTRYKVLIHRKNYIDKKIAQMKAELKKADESISLAYTERKSIEELKKQIKSVDRQIAALEKEAEDVKNLISYTRLVSPYSGYIAKKFVSEGEVVPSGRPVYSIVPENSLYILVLLEETKLKGVKIGSEANIYIDAFPDKTFKGKVFEISPATAAKFALVPRDVTAGEFTKVAQRIPVKIKITEGDTSILKVGLGGEVEIRKSRD